MQQEIKATYLQKFKDNPISLNLDYIEKAEEITASTLELCDSIDDDKKGLKHFIAQDLLINYTRIVLDNNGLYGIFEQEVEQYIGNNVFMVLEDFEYDEIITIYPQLKDIVEILEENYLRDLMCNKEP